MILIPSLIDSTLDRSLVIERFAKVVPKRKFGVVAITPSFKRADDWVKSGALSPKTETIWKILENLREGNCEETVAIANRYDGIDLPDSTCRILILDDVTGEICTKWNERESTWRKSRSCQSRGTSQSRS
jgi:hypothetical protein